jgi:tetratricopeptide (TPR) repeat protein/predicted Ser/Thr protein kinase
MDDASYTLAATDAPRDRSLGEVDEGPLRSGTHVGRYVVLERVGAGGMGSVYAAYDPQLDRRVALKLLHAGPRPQSRERLLAEAQAMARLHHPNVVVVHDVGVADGAAFVAMEYVDGQTLGRWREAAKRSVPEVLRAFVAAGRGLAAAHRAGLIHRDFKPANVLVAQDGRVLVTDFGLAQPPSTREPDSLGVEPERTEPSGLHGTPAYMAPEQFAQQEIDARTDQFGFCVALHEALYGERPFRAESLVELAQVVLAGDPVRVPRGRGVPVRVGRALERGLRRAPAERWPSMEALLGAIDPDRRRRRGMRAVVVGALALGAVLWARAEPRMPEGCREPRDAIWSESARAQAQQAFAAVEADAAYWDPAARALDGYLGRFDALRQEVCEQHARGSIDEASAYATLACLHDQQVEIQALTELWARADREVAEGAMQTVTRLPAARTCEHGRSPEKRTSDEPALDPEELARLRRARAHAMVRSMAGRYDEAEAIVDAVLPVGAATPRTGVVADLLRLRAFAYHDRGDIDRAEDEYWRSLAVALAAEDHVAATHTWSWLIMLRGLERGQPSLALQWVPLALQQAGPDPTLRCAIFLHQATVLFEANRFDEAERVLSAALPEAEQAYEHAPEDLSKFYTNRATYLVYLGRAEQAEQAFRHALALAESAWGMDSPEIMDEVANLARFANARGDAASRDQHRQRALALAQRWERTSPSDAATAVRMDAGLSAHQGHFRAAARAYRRALELRERVSGPANPLLCTGLVELARMQYLAGDGAGVRASMARAREALEPDIARDAGCYVQVLEVLARQALTDGALEEAAELVERAAAVRQQQNSPEDPQRLELRIVMMLTRGALPDALARLRELEAAGGRAVDLWPGERVLQARVLARLGRHEEALAQLDSLPALEAELGLDAMPDMLPMDDRCERALGAAEVRRAAAAAGLTLDPRAAVERARAECGGSDPPLVDVDAALASDRAPTFAASVRGLVVGTPIDP